MLEKMPSPVLSPVLVFDDMKKMKHAHATTSAQLAAANFFDGFTCCVRSSTRPAT